MAQSSATEAVGQEPERDETMQERLDAPIGEAQAPGALAARRDRAVDGLEGIFGEHAVVAQTLDVEQPSIGHKADLAQLRQIVQALADAEVIGVVDRSLGTQGPIFLVILLDARVLVVDIQGRSDVLGEDTGAKPPRGAAIDLAVEDQLDLLRPAEIEVLADHLLEEQSAVHRPVEHLRQGELGLQDRDVVAVAGLAIRPSERMRQQAQPLAQKAVDLLRREAVTDFLQLRGSGTAEHAIVERLEGDAFLRELALGVFMAVQAELGIERKVAAELEEERTEIAVDRIDVIVVHHRGGPIPIYEPWLSDIVQRNVRERRLSFTTNSAQALHDPEVVFIAVGTPSRRGDGHADLTYVY